MATPTYMIGRARLIGHTTTATTTPGSLLSAGCKCALNMQEMCLSALPAQPRAMMGNKPPGGPSFVIRPSAQSFHKRSGPPLSKLQRAMHDDRRRGATKSVLLAGERGIALGPGSAPIRCSDKSPFACPALILYACAQPSSDEQAHSRVGATL